MNKLTRFLSVAIVLFAPALQAQRAPAFELGIFAQYSKFDDFTRLENGIGAGARGTLYFLPRLALEYEGDFTRTKSALVGDLTALNHRANLIYHIPIAGKYNLLVGGGWTGTQYATDTTKNQYDSGLNAMAGVKYCLSDVWSWRADVNVDFKDPSDQTPSGERTRTWNVRLGFNRFLFGPASNSPCYRAPAPPPPPAAVTPAPAPQPQPAPQPPPQPAPQPAPTPPVVTPTPQPAPPPAAPERRDLLTLKGNNFKFDSATLTPGAKDTLQQTIRILKDNPTVNVEIQGHTDWIGTDQYNQALSERRANSVRAYFIEQGISASRITTIGFGEARPTATNETAAGRALNRRTVIVEIRER
jgi:outer membrane protein OmpA-like peptidoglycan-associated protein